MKEEEEERGAFDLSWGLSLCFLPLLLALFLCPVYLSDKRESVQEIVKFTYTFLGKLVDDSFLAVL